MYPLHPPHPATQFVLVVNQSMYSEGWQGSFWVWHDGLLVLVFRLWDHQSRINLHERYWILIVAERLGATTLPHKQCPSIRPCVRMDGGCVRARAGTHSSASSALNQRRRRHVTWDEKSSIKIFSSLSLFIRYLFYRYIHTTCLLPFLVLPFFFLSPRLKVLAMSPLSVRGSYPLIKYCFILNWPSS